MATGTWPHLSGPPCPHSGLRPLLTVSSLHPAPSTFVLHLWDVRSTSCRGPSPVPGLSPSSQRSQGPQCYCFQLKKKNISSSPSSFPSPQLCPASPAEPCRRGQGGTDLGDMPTLVLSSKGKLSSPFPNSRLLHTRAMAWASAWGSRLRPSAGADQGQLAHATLEASSAAGSRQELTCKETCRVNSRTLLVLAKLETLFLLDRDSDKC